MTPERRRLWLVVGLTVLTVGGMGVAWWLRPSPDDPETLLRPLPATVRAPPLPPPTAAPPLPPVDGDETDDSDTDEEEVGSLPDGVLPDPDLGEAYLGRTEDGAPVRAVTPVASLPLGALGPDRAGVSGLAVGPGHLLIEVTSIEGTAIGIADRPPDGTIRPISLAGWAEGQTGVARPRRPVMSKDGAWFIAQLPQGDAGVWVIDLEAGTAAPAGGTGLPRPANPTHLDADTGVVAAVFGGAQVGLLQQGAWSLVAQGPAAITDFDVAAGAAGPEVAVSRLGRVSLLTPDRTVPQALGRGAHPVRLPGYTAWVADGLVQVQPDDGEATSAGAIRLLNGDSLVPVGTDRVAWIRPDGRLGLVRVGGDPEAVQLDLQTVSALASHGAAVAVSGRVGLDRRLEILEF